LNVTLDVKDEERVFVNLDFTFPGETGEVYFSFPNEIREFSSDGGNCRVESGYRNLIICQPPSPFMVGQVNINVNFYSKGPILLEDNKRLFNLDIPILIDTNKLNIELKLPEMMVVASNEMAPISPSGAKIGSDGRRITLSWYFEDQFNGDIIPIRVYYEGVGPTNFFRLISLKWILIFFLLLVVSGFLVYEKFFSRKKPIVLSILNEAEKIVVEAIEREGGKNVDQRNIVSSTGFSKAKVSRILQNLEARGILKIERIGRKNRVTINKNLVEGETEQ